MTVPKLVLIFEILFNSIVMILKTLNPLFFHFSPPVPSYLRYVFTMSKLWARGNLVGSSVLSSNIPFPSTLTSLLHSVWSTFFLITLYFHGLVVSSPDSLSEIPSWPLCLSLLLCEHSLNSIYSLYSSFPLFRTEFRALFTVYKDLCDLTFYPCPCHFPLVDNAWAPLVADIVFKWSRLGAGLVV